jgi:Protein of unknown function (DUF732)
MRTTPRLLTALAHASLGAAALAALAVVPGHAVAAPQAADYRYVQRLTDDHWTVDDREQLIRVAHAECGIRGQGKSNAELAAEVASHYRITAEAARSQLAAAEAVYCPDKSVE